MSSGLVLQVELHEQPLQPHDASPDLKFLANLRITKKAAIPTILRTRIVSIISYLMNVKFSYTVKNELVILRIDVKVGLHFF